MAQIMHSASLGNAMPSSGRRLSCPSPLPLGPGATLFCDFDGPLIDVSDRYYGTYRQALALVSGHNSRQCPSPDRPTLSKAEFWRMKQIRRGDRTIAQASGLAGTEIDRFLAEVQRLVNQPDGLHQDRLQPYVRPAIQQLKSYGIRIVLVTLRQSSQVHDLLHAYGLENSISGVYGAIAGDAAYNNHGEHKTALLKAAIAAQEASGFGTHTAWMVGDTEADIVAGQTMGLPTLAVTCGVRSGAYLKGYRPTVMQSDFQQAVEFLLARRPVLERV